jgi:hypothetical protein
MSMVRLTLLFLLVLLLALAVVPAIAGESVTVGDVTFECKITGSANDGFSILATNSGKTDKKCKASCTLTKKDGKSKQTWEHEHPVSGFTGEPGDKPRIQMFYGEGDISGAPLSNPEVTASCE